MKNFKKFQLVAFALLTITCVAAGQDYSKIFHSIEEALKSPENVVELHLYESYNDKTLPDEIKNCKNLQSINLQLTNLTDEECEKLLEFFPDLELLFLPCNN